MKKIDKNLISIIIRDNGKGLYTSVHKGHGIGTRVNRERMKLINAQNRQRFNVTVENNNHDKGVCVEILIHENERN